MAKTLIVKITCDRCKAEGAGDEVEGEESVSFAYDPSLRALSRSTS
jgi:hypothetical protein